MAKELIPVKLISEIKNNEAGGVILQYQLKVDGVLDPRKFYTVKVNNGIDLLELNSVIADAKSLAEQSEGIGE